MIEARSVNSVTLSRTTSAIGKACERRTPSRIQASITPPMALVVRLSVTEFTERASIIVN
jgi:hypothetical protein